MATKEQIASVIALQQDNDTGLTGWGDGQYAPGKNDPYELAHAKTNLEEGFVVSTVVIDAFGGTAGNGDTEQAVYTVTYDDTDTVTETSIATWASSDEAVTTVDSEGLITVVGTATDTADITATVDGITSAAVTLTVA